MNKILSNNFMRSLFASALALVVIFGNASIASAGWNDVGAGGCATFVIGNVTTGQNIASPCWTGANISASAGNTINVVVYFHNTGNTTVNNATVRITNPGTGAVSGSQSFSGNLMVGGTTVASGAGSVAITSGSATFNLTKVVVQRQSTGGAIELLANPQDIFSSNGIAIGAVTPGWNGQGVVKAVFTLQEANVNPPAQNQLPTVATYAANSISNELGNATLNGYFNANGSNTSTHFQYRRNNNNWSYTSTQNNGLANGTFSRNLTGLASGNYEFQAVATNAAGTVYGASKFFTISNNNTPDPDPVDPCDNGGCNDTEPVVDTDSATNIDEDSAKLRGDLVDNGGDDTDVYFEWGTSSSNLNHTTDMNNMSGEGSFSDTITGLDNDRTYYFRACGENTEGSDCGSIESFRTDGEEEGPESDRPSITTLSAISIGATTAVVDGYFDANGCSVTTYFQYGRTNNLGSTTASVNRGDNSGSMAYGFTSLAPNTTYYYRAVGKNCEGTSYGTTRSFTTTTNTNTNNTNTTTTVFTGNGGSSFIRLMITNNRELVRDGRDIAYDVSWENISGRDLSDIVLEINFPEQMIITDTDKGDIQRNRNSVIVELAKLDRREKGDMTVFTEVGRGLRDGDPVVVQAIMAFENPTTQATENAIAYDSDEFSSDAGNGLGASLFGLDFLPTSLAGWLLILLIILIIVVITRYFLRQNKVVESHTVTTPAAPGTTSHDYIVYQPTPKN